MKFANWGIVLGAIVVAIGLIVAAGRLEIRKQQSEPDYALRNLLRVQGIRGEVKVPKGMTHYAVVPIIFEKGNKIRGGGSPFAIGPVEDRKTVFAEILYGKVDGEYKLFMHGTGIGTHSTKPVLEHLNGWTNIDSDDTSMLPNWNDISILAFAQSSVNYEGEEDAHFGRFEMALQQKKYVMALGVIFFASEAEKDKFYSKWS